MIRQLDSRITASGDVIELVWNDETDSTELRVHPPEGEARTVSVDKEHAADCFRHPYVYLPVPAGSAA